ncbi:pseudouridine synthase [Steroidobacter sp. S1-65]|uniref:Pseudouridine synthase n=2 Tax=Steroidobacter gossypii TaxID=2805490 RepID=A0ABS1WXJ8_9GAMM|nr:pseudouridine synthase [Steroidobacter gossypii]MBM0105688.1 pseudouridine synthase [Steroidobacter gossypii]
MNAPALLLLNKPYRVLTQFTSQDGKATLRDYVHAPGMRPAGRLDYDSEGLVLLTDSGSLQTRLADPRWKQEKSYLVQVEGEIDDQALERLRRGVNLNDGMTLPADAERIDEPAWLWPRDPPIRFRKAIPASWLELTIREGRNRQVRRMTAAVNLPTLRLIRWSVGPWTLEGLAPGQSRAVEARDVQNFLKQITSRYRPASSRATRR